MGASVWVHGCTCMGILSTMACPVSGCQQYARKLKLVKSKDRVLLCKPVKGVLVIPLAQFLAFVIVNLINYMGYESLCLFPVFVYSQEYLFGKPKVMFSHVFTWHF